MLKDYFRLGMCLKTLQRGWCVPRGGDQAAKVEPNGAAKDDEADTSTSDATQLQKRLHELLNGSQGLRGLRLIRQPPRETLFSYICSQNSNVPRIMSLVEKLAANFGERIGEVDGQEFFSFPSIASLADVSEAKYRDLGFGYRAKYLHAAAKEIMSHAEEAGSDAAAHKEHSHMYQDPSFAVGDAWLQDLRRAPVEEARRQLVGLTGIGPKVADCISLSALDKLECVPVDTHIRQLAERYLRGVPSNVKSLTPKVYDAITKGFQASFGEGTGWAQCVLFAGELAVFKKAEREEKAAKKEEKVKKRQRKESKGTPSKRRKVQAKSEPKTEY